MKSYRSIPTRLCILLVATAAAACDGAAQERESAPATAVLEQASEQPPQAAVLSDTVDSYEIRIAEGPFAGVHRGTRELNCFAQDGMWGADFSIEGGKDLTMMLMHARGVPGNGGSTSDVHLNLIFGEPGDMMPGSGTTGIGSAIGGGAGQATVTRDGKTALIRIEGTTVHKSPITAVLRCGSFY